MNQTVESLFREMLPEDTAVAAGPVLSDAVLLPEESAAVARALESRRLDFASGRAYAREAMAQLGLGSIAIPANPDRSPRWPDSIVGSITHTHGLVAAAAASRRRLAGLGIDAESRARPLANGIQRLICTPAETELLSAWPHTEELDAIRLIFSAKESVHKCVAPVCGVTLGFRDVALQLDPERRSFAAVLLRDAPTVPPFSTLHGRFRLSPDYVLTAAWITAA